MDAVVLAALYGGFGGMVRAGASLYRQYKDDGKEKVKNKLQPKLTALSVGLSAATAVIFFYGMDAPIVADVVKPLLGEVTPFALIGAGFMGVDLIEKIFSRLQIKK